MLATTPCGLPVINRRARLVHVLVCSHPDCCMAGANELRAAAAFRELGSQIDAAAILALGIIREELPI